MEQAVAAAKAAAAAGDIISLSPGCTGFDMFRDFEERGNIYKEVVKAL